MTENSMEGRISKIEQELAVMAATQRSMKAALEEISHTLKELLSLQADTKVLQTKINNIDSETREAFKRVYRKQEEDQTVTSKRLDKVENILIWGVRSLFALGVSLSIYVLQKLI